MTLALHRADGVWTQQLCDSGRNGTGQHAAVEGAVASGEPDVRVIPGRNLRKEIVKWLASGALARRFETAIRSTRWIEERADGSKIACSLNRGYFVTSYIPRRVPICQVALAIESGPPSALHAFARELSKSLPLTLETRSQIDRGYAFWLREPLTAPSKAEPLFVPPRATAGEMLTRIIGNGVDHLHRNWRSARETKRYDPEHVHQMRVASRRLRTAFSLFGQVHPELKAHPLVGELRWLAGVLGTARNWDVLLAETFPHLLATFPGEPALVSLARRAALRRRQARRTVAEALDSDRYQELVLDLGELGMRARAQAVFANPARTVAAQLLSRRDRTFRKRAEQLAHLSAADRHELRIAAKKLRYAAEFFGSLFSARKRGQFLQRFSRLQTELGVLNDVATTRALMGSLAEGADPQLQRALGLCIGWTAGIEQGSLAELTRCGRRVQQAERFWPNIRSTPMHASPESAQTTTHDANEEAVSPE
jgi:triphosphatase